MITRTWARKSIVSLVLASLVVHLFSCGTIFYPERKGQTGGKIDPGVAVLDGLGLLLFVIPGLIAFAVDFSNGTIYYPRGHGSLDGQEEGGQFLAIAPDSEKLTEETIELALREQLGISVDLSATGVEVIGLESLESAREHTSDR